jgi:parvulin-like peptidyl-prolyl isomerase
MARTIKKRSYQNKNNSSSRTSSSKSLRKTATRPEKISSSVEIAKKKRPLIKFLVIWLLVILGLGVVSLLVLLIGIYRNNWAEKNRFVNKIVKSFPLPVAKVNKEFIPLRDFYQDLASLKKYSNQQKNALGSLPSLSDKDYKEMVLTKLVTESFLRQEAAKMNIKISDQEIEAEFQKLIKSSKSKEDLEKMSRELYGWDLEDVKKKLIYPYVLRNKIQSKIIDDPELNQRAYKKAEEVKKLLKQKKNFLDLIKKYSETPEASREKTFFVTRTDNWDSAFLETAFKLSEKEISDMVKGRDGFYFIKLERIIPPTKKKPETREVRYIFIAHKTVEKWFLENQDKLKVKFFLPHMEWNKQEGRVTLKA